MHVFGLMEEAGVPAKKPMNAQGEHGHEHGTFLL